MRLADVIRHIQQQNGKAIPYFRVTPQLAEEILANNWEHNRGMRRHRVPRIEHDMRCNKWLKTGDPIRVDKFGTLIDGQHRLQAIVNTGITVEMAITIVGKDDYVAIDQSMPRRSSDVLRAEGVTNPLLASAVAMAMVRRGRDGSASGTWSHARISEYYRRNSDAIEWTIQMFGMSIYRRADMLGAVVLCVGQYGRGVMTRFCQSLVDNQFMGKSDPPNVLARWSMKLKLEGKVAARKELFDKTCYVIKAYLEGRKITSLLSITGQGLDRLLGGDIAVAIEGEGGK